MNWYFKGGMLFCDANVSTESDKPYYRFMTDLIVKLNNNESNESNELNDRTIRTMKTFRVATKKGTNLILPLKKMDKWYYQNDLTKQYNTLIHLREFPVIPERIDF